MSRFVQLALDLFAPEPPASAAQPVGPAEPVRSPRAPVGSISPRPLDQLLAPARFAHPQANRELRLDDSVIAYLFKRAKRRSIGFVVGPDGLVVSAPTWVPMAEVDAAVRDKGRWVVQKLGEVRARQSQQEAARIVWRDGCVIPYLGSNVQLLLDPTHGFKGIGALTAGEGAQEGQDAGARGMQRLCIGLAHSATPEQIRDAAQAWLMREAKALFAQRLAHYAPLLGVQWSKLSLSSAGTRWGSASSSGAIRLNWRLVHLKLAVIDYVVVHELSHLRVMDHSPRFWDTVATIVPDYALLRSELKQGAVPQW